MSSHNNDDHDDAKYGVPINETAVDGGVRNSQELVVKQVGVVKAEAVAKTWTKSSLYLAYSGLVLFLLTSSSPSVWVISLYVLSLLVFTVSYIQHHHR